MGPQVAETKKRTFPDGTKSFGNALGSPSFTEPSPPYVLVNQIHKKENGSRFSLDRMCDVVGEPVLFTLDEFCPSVRCVRNHSFPMIVALESPGARAGGGKRKLMTRNFFLE
uniref:Uncharacterized protein n=1 Tax=Entomoneis paludosa TaxID=265537 RepID=A0A7S2Y924_9STRA